MLARLTRRGASARTATLAATSSSRTLATVASPAQEVPTFHPSRLPPYSRLLQNLAVVRAILNRPLTLSEKILYSHLINPEETLTGAGGSDVSKIRGSKYLALQVDRLAMQGECALSAPFLRSVPGLEGWREAKWAISRAVRDINLVDGGGVSALQLH